MPFDREAQRLLGRIAGHARTALLAASGRRSDARDALERYRRRLADAPDSGYKFGVFVDRLGAWLG